MRLSFLIILVGINTYSQTVSLEGVNIIDVLSGTINENQNILLNGEYIESIGSKPFVNARKRINLRGKYMIPGLWDMHVHLTNLGSSSFPLFVINGVTGVRDMGGDWNKLKTWQTQNSSNWPVIYSPGPILESKAFYQLVQTLMGPEFVKSRIPIDSEVDINKAIDSLYIEGIRFIKVRTVKDKATLSAITKACKVKGMRLVGHIEPNLDIVHALESGLFSVEHALFFQVLKASPSKRDSIIQAFKRNSPFFTPTLIATKATRLVDFRIKDSLPAAASEFVSPELDENWRVFDAIKALESPMQWDSLYTVFNNFSKKILNPSTLLAGTDLGVPGLLPGSSLHMELELMVNELGISNLNAIRAATINPCKALGITSKYGSISEGKIASILILNKNPLLDISHLKNIHIVINRGETIDKKMTLQLEKGIKKEIKVHKKEYQNNILIHLKDALKRMGVN
ncbi:amidohydrolase family protein [Muricauda sp. 2012CJ35-5]|uniref:Amidohydrolase family protein n=1 Tax=Flagellimonas spongiicola TaxID=2942208 RepID=A0ABT0PQT8_9FLAO|nr:amidohydrolase family protein [Allomuricauda spongiicola]MCL6273760.1 amidohydrolase family protein [Allomuricauda spongiicola]